MDELEISGRRYISSVRAAKEHKDHSDYIGQLVRGGKVVGQKVGRAWYVDADSLAEYLGKEVPPRGPMSKVPTSTPVEESIKEKIPAFVVEEQMEESSERPVAEPADVRDLSSEPLQNQSEFVLPLRKSGRLHTIEALPQEPVEETPKEIIVEPAAEEIETEIETIVVEETVEEETFIPLKITKEPARDIYAEPEDSFYKVSRKGLRYVEPRTHQELLQETRAIPSPVRPAAKERRAGRKVVAAISLVLAAGVLSLGAGVLMSYYLHSITTVEEAGQTSSVILSN